MIAKMKPTNQGIKIECPRYVGGKAWVLLRICVKCDHHGGLFVGGVKCEPPADGSELVF